MQCHKALIIDAVNLTACVWGVQLLGQWSGKDDGISGVFFFGFHYLCLLSVTMFSVTEKKNVCPLGEEQRNNFVIFACDPQNAVSREIDIKRCDRFSISFKKKRKKKVHSSKCCFDWDENVKVFNTFISFIGLSYLFFIVSNNVSDKNLVFLHLCFNLSV